MSSAFSQVQGRAYNMGLVNSAKVRRVGKEYVFIIFILLCHNLLTKVVIFLTNVFADLVKDWLVYVSAAAFFITYDYVKWFLHTDSSSHLMPVKHMLAASAGEVVSNVYKILQKYNYVCIFIYAQSLYRYYFIF